jgi:hypothetical protein
VDFYVPFGVSLPNSLMDFCSAGCYRGGGLWCQYATKDVEEIGDFLYLIKETDYMNAWWFEKNVVYLFQVF